MTPRIGGGFQAVIAALPGALLALALVIVSPADAQTRPPAASLSPFEQAFLNYLTATANTAFCVTQSDLGTSTPASSSCNVARSYAFGNSVTGSEVRGLIPRV